MEWFRFYTDTVHDRKIRRLPPAQRWLWVAVLTVAKMSPEPGKLLLSERNVTETLHVTGEVTASNVAVTNDDLSDIAKVDIQDVEDGMKAFQTQNMVHVDDGVYVVTHWKKRQYISDSSADRVKRHRDKTRRYSNVTVTPPETDTDTETERDKDQKIAVGGISEIEIQIGKAYEQSFHYTPNKVQLSKLSYYTELGMEIELIYLAIRKTRLKGADINYLFRILDNQYDRGIRTIAQAELDDAKHQTAAGGGFDERYSVRSRTSPTDGNKRSITSGKVGKV